MGIDSGAHADAMEEKKKGTPIIHRVSNRAPLILVNFSIIKKE